MDGVDRCAVRYSVLLGFFSNEIIDNASHNGYQFFYYVALVGAFMTPAYMTRATYLTFFGKPYGAAAGEHHDEGLTTLRVLTPIMTITTTTPTTITVLTMIMAPTMGRTNVAITAPLIVLSILRSAPDISMRLRLAPTSPIGWARRCRSCAMTSMGTHLEEESAGIVFAAVQAGDEEYDGKARLRIR